MNTIYASGQNRENVKVNNVYFENRTGGNQVDEEEKQTARLLPSGQNREMYTTRTNNTTATFIRY